MQTVVLIYDALSSEPRYREGVVVLIMNIVRSLIDVLIMNDHDVTRFFS